MGPTALRPIRRTKQWYSVLLKDTSVTAGDTNPHSDEGKLGKDSKWGGRGNSRELGKKTTKFKLARIKKSELQHCDSKVF